MRSAAWDRPPQLQQSRRRQRRTARPVRTGRGVTSWGELQFCLDVAGGGRAMRCGADPVLSNEWVAVSGTTVTRRPRWHIRLRAWVVLAGGTARASYFRLIRNGAVLPTLRAWRGGPPGGRGPPPPR